MCWKLSLEQMPWAISQDPILNCESCCFCHWAIEIYAVLKDVQEQIKIML